MDTQPGRPLRLLNGSLVALSVLVLAVGLFYTFAFAALTPFSGITMVTSDIGWTVLSIDACQPHPGWCEANQDSLQAGDLLLSIGDLTYRDYWADRRRVPFIGYGPGETVPIILKRDEQTQTVNWEMPGITSADRVSRLSGLLFFLPFWLAGTTVLLFLRPRDTRWRLLISFNYLTAIWLVTGIISTWQVAAAAVVLHTVTWLLAPVYLHLHLIIPTPLLGRRARAVLFPLYGVTAGLAGLELFHLLPRFADYLGLLLALLGSLGLLVFHLFRETSPAARLAVRLMVAGIGLAFGPGIALWVIPMLLDSASQGVLVINFATLALPVLPLFYVYAIYKRHLGALEFRANRLLSLYSFTLLYLTAFVLTFWMGHPSLSDRSGLFDLAVSTLFILAAPALRARFQRLVNRLAYGVEHNPDDIVRVFAHRIPTAPDREALVRLLADEVAPSLLIRQSALYLLGEQDPRLLYAHGISPAETPEGPEQVQPLLAEASQYRPAPTEAPLVIGNDHAREPHPPARFASPDDRFAEQGRRQEKGDGGVRSGVFDWVRLVIPLETQQKTIGVWLFGRRDPDDYYPQDDITLLSTLANQVALAVENARLFADANRRLERLQALRQMDMAIMASLDLNLTFRIFLGQATQQLHVDAVDILLLNPHTQTLEYAAGNGFRTAALQHTRLRLGESHAGRALRERRLIHIPNLAEGAGELVRAPLLAREDFVAYYAVPLIAKGQAKGVLEVFHRAPLDAGREWLDYLETLAGQAAIAMDNAALFNDLQRSNAELALAYDTTLEGWSHALELRDQETEGHTRRVTEMTVSLARAMGMHETELVYIRRGALLHDIGKMGVPDSILLKPGPLTEAEWAVMRQHPAYAYELLSPIAYLGRALDIPYCHHERWDGTGYPRGLKGEQIPLPARIFAVVDVWDALRSDRPYRPAWSEERVREHIREQAGQHFDPRVVEVFLSQMPMQVQPPQWI